MKFENKIFNNIQYTLVEIYKTEKYGDIYHFANDTSDIFCEKIDNYYAPIEDRNVIQAIIEDYNLKKPEVIFFSSFLLQVHNLFKGISDTKKLSHEQVESVIDEAVSKLAELKCNINQNELKSILRKVSFYSANLGNLSKKGFYYAVLNSICYREKDILSENNLSKRIRLHEIIHALSGKKAFYDDYSRLLGLVEGATENIVEKLYGEQVSSYAFDTGMRFNFSEAAEYKCQVAIIRQMEYALEVEADEDILHGKKDFFDNFAEKYGKEALRVISHRVNRLTFGEAEQEKKEEKCLEFNRNQYFKETQNIILRSVFDKEFEKIYTIEDAKNYFTKLQGFEIYRGKEIGKEDKDFKDYYNYQLGLIKAMLIEKGYNEEQVSKFFQEHQYKKQKFYPLYRTTLENEKLIVDLQMIKFAFATIATMLEDEQDVQNRFGEFGFYRGLKGSYDDEYREYLLITRNGKPISIQVLENYMYRKHYKAKDGNLDLPSNLSFIQNEDGFSIDEYDDNITRLKEANISIEDLKSIKHRAVSFQENSQVMEALLKIAKTQRLSVINRVISKIKSSFLNIDKTQNYTMEDEQK